MPSSHQNSFSDAATPSSPATWDVEALLENWTEHLRTVANENDPPIPPKRLANQAQESPVYQEIINRWPQMDGPTRVASWKRLLEDSESYTKELLPFCAQCGECCRKGSPSLHLEDMELLREGKIPWDRLVTIRRGEPVRSPFNEKLFFLLDDRVKIREKAGIQECVFLDESDHCSIYEDRPIQCRAQACWDPTLAQQLGEQAYLTRRDIFKEIEVLIDLMAEHDRRCAFDKLQAVIKQMEADEEGKSIDKVIELFAYEDHFRHSVAEQLKIPESILPLVFGRSLADLAPLFGFRVETQEDGTRCLVADKD